jgi:6-phosphogluconolactonase (cycloisomerase 2 family)
MKALIRLVVAAAIGTVVAAAGAGAAVAAPVPGPWCYGAGAHVVFVQTDGTAGNHVVVYDRADNGSLLLNKAYATGGLGGVLSGSVVDHLASQGSLLYDQQDSLLYAVNAGSNSVSVFAVRGDQLTLVQVVGSGGTFPVSVAAHGDLVYVLNAEDGGSVQGYVVFFDHLFPIPGWTRSLGLNPTATPQYTNTPGQVAFSPDGSQLIVTTKANGNDIDVFHVGYFGLSAKPVVNVETGSVPFGVSFDPAGHLIVADAGTEALSSFSLSANGTLTELDSVPTGQAATCWVEPAAGWFYASNAGSATVSGYRAQWSGQLSLLGATATDPGTVDAAASSDGRYLYVQTGGKGIVDEFRVNVDGSLSELGSVTVAGSVGGEGIAAT